MKKCSRCALLKPITEYYKDSSSSDGFSCQCADCRRRATKEYRSRYPERSREVCKKWRTEHPDRSKRSVAKYYSEHKDKIRKQRLRYVSENRDKIRVAATIWRKNNKDKVLAQNSRYREKNREMLSERQRTYYANNATLRKEYGVRYAASNADKVAAWRKKINANRAAIKLEWGRHHPEISRESQRRRRARIKNGTIIKFTQCELSARLSMRGNKCWICGGAANHVDHVKPIAKGGAHALCNLRPICKKCNCAKRDIWPLDKIYKHFGMAS
jgi:hypothetical protein